MVQVTRQIVLAGLFVMLCLAPNTVEAKIEAIKGKKYELTKQHGPWMIMVVSLAEPPPEYRADGPGPSEAAADLVYELRKKGIPAYTYDQPAESESFGKVERNGKTFRRTIKTKEKRICVVAGNYQSSGDAVGQKTLAYLKAFNPKLFEQHAVFQSTPGRPGPLSGAFLTINPLLSAEEIAQRKVDPVLLKINGDRRYSLLSNNAKFTLVVASFHGRSKLANRPGGLEEDSQVGKALDEAAHQAEILCRALREKELHFGRKHDAFVWHDSAKSLVCVGSFDSDKDPMIARTFKLFAECSQLDQSTKTQRVMPQTMLVPETDKKSWITPSLPSALTRGKRVDPLPKHAFAFDPKPQLMQVPLSNNKLAKADY